MERYNFVEIDKQGNHNIRLTGDNQEHRVNLMTASEDLYEALDAIIQHFRKLDKLYSKDLEMLNTGSRALSKVEVK